MTQLSRSLGSSHRRGLAFIVLSALAVPAFAGSALADAEVQAQPTVEPAGAKQHQGTQVNVSGEVSRYVLGPLGHVHAFLLKDGTAVMVHETAGDAMAKDVPVGTTVRVEGWSPASSNGKAVMHAAVYDQQKQIVTPPARGGGGGDRLDPSVRKERESEFKAEIEKLPSASAKGTVVAVIPGHHGKARAVVLSDGTSVFLRRSLAKAVMARGIRVGDEIQSSGKGATYPLGASVFAGDITFADGTHFEARSGGSTGPA